MKAVVVSLDLAVKLQTDFPTPERKANEALVRVKRAGICNTDLEITKGYVPGFNGILGHEFLGEIVEIDENIDKGLTKSQRVVGEINLACGNCTICTGGGIPKRNHCPNRTVLGIINKHGTFAEYLTLPVENLFAVPESISDEDAAFAEPLAAAFRIVEQIKTSATDKIAVIGDGKLGNLITQVMSTQPNLSLTLFGKHKSKFDKIPQENVIKVLVDSETSRIYESKFDVCIEASGSPNGLMMAASITRPLGTLVLKSTCAAGASDFNTTPFVVKEIITIGSRCGNFELALNALQTKSVHVAHLVDKVYALDDAPQAIEAASVKGAMKIQLIM